MPSRSYNVTPVTQKAKRSVNSRAQFFSLAYGERGSNRLITTTMAQLVAANAKSARSPPEGGVEMQLTSTAPTTSTAPAGSKADRSSRLTSGTKGDTPILGELIDGEFHRYGKGLSWLLAAFVIMGDLAGSALVALPTAVQGSGWIGPFPTGLLLVLAVSVGSTVGALQLATCWRILLRYWPEYHSYCRKPYAEIGLRAVGPKIRMLSSINVFASQFGIVVVFFLLSSKNIRDVLLNHFDSGIPSVCLLVIIHFFVLFPVTLLKSPADFAWVVVCSMLATACAMTLIMVGTFKDYAACHPVVENAPFKMLNLLAGAGTLCFAWGGHPTLPLIHQDLKRPQDFRKSLLFAFITVSIMYTVVIFAVNSTYGNALHTSVINSIQTSWIQQSINLLIACHCITATVIMINPVNQEAEEWLGIEQSFGMKRVLVRAGMLALVVVVAESLPNFGPFLGLLGSSAFSMTIFVLPAIFFLFLLAREQKIQNGEDDGPLTLREVFALSPWSRIIWCCLLGAFGLVGGGLATIASIYEVSTTHFELPCYLKPFIADNEANMTVTATYCCGPNQNVTSSGASLDQCSSYSNYFG